LLDGHLEKEEVLIEKENVVVGWTVRMKFWLSIAAVD